MAIFMSEPTPTRSSTSNGSFGKISCSTYGIKEAGRIVAAHAERRLRQVVRAEAEELGDRRDLVGRQGAARDLDHRADQVRELHALLLHHFHRRAAHDLLLVRELLHVAHERDHDLRLHLDAALLHVRRGFKDRARLHLGDLREDDAQTATAEAEHRVEFVQTFHPCMDLLVADAHLCGEFTLCLLIVRHELMQRRIDRTDRHRPAVHRLEDPLEVLTLQRQQLCQGALRASSVSARIISRIGPIFPSPKNMCSVRHRPIPSAPNAIALLAWSG